MSEQNNGLAASPSDWPKALFAVALLFSIFQIITAAFHPVSTQVLRAVHVGFLLLMVARSMTTYMRYCVLMVVPKVCCGPARLLPAVKMACVFVFTARRLASNGHRKTPMNCGFAN